MGFILVNLKTLSGDGVGAHSCLHFVVGACTAGHMGYQFTGHSHMAGMDTIGLDVCQRVEFAVQRYVVLLCRIDIECHLYLADEGDIGRQGQDAPTEILRDLLLLLDFQLSFQLKQYNVLYHITKIYINAHKDTQ